MHKTAFLIADLGFGDAGKGSTVDFVARRTDVHTVVRYNGGAQAGHNVVTPDGRHHTFAQFGSGTFVSGVRTHLSRFMLVSPGAMLREEAHLRTVGVRDAFERTTIDRRALVITPFQQAANRLRELARGEGRHGSCGMGIGETMADYLAMGSDMLFAGDLLDETMLRRKLKNIRAVKWEQLQSVLERLPDTEAARRELSAFLATDAVDYAVELYGHFAHRARIVDAAYLEQILQQPGTTVFEGAQGVLLDEWHGFHPYTTWSTTTFAHAHALLQEAGFCGEAIRLGLTRAYATRHGPGPFPTEDEALTKQVPDVHNGMNPWQRAFRVGHLDLPLLRYACEAAGGIDYLVVSCLDRLAGRKARYADRYALKPTHDEDASYFTFDETGHVVQPRVDHRRDLAHQEHLGRLLEACIPPYECVDSARDVPALLAHALGTPVAITSHGPTAGNKEVAPLFARTLYRRRAA